MVVTVNVAEFDPPGIVIDPGTVAVVVSELRLTTIPPARACADSVTVPVEDEPPATLLGFSARLEIWIGLTVSRAFAVALRLAEIVSTCAPEVGTVVTLKVC